MCVQPMENDAGTRGTPSRAVLDWLLEGDPSIRWQVLRDLNDAPAHEVETERTRVGTEGWGARLLAAQAPDGSWSGAAWNRGWSAEPLAHPPRSAGAALVRVARVTPAAFSARRARLS